MELKNELTPVAAILDFEARYFKGLFKHKAGEKKPPGYDQCKKAIYSAHNEGITFERAVRILTKYAPPGAYQITEKIEATADANGPAFKAALEKIWAENEGDLDETKI